MRILHLEDDAADAELVQTMLESEGLACDVVRVDNEADFVASLDQGRFDVILADHTLPAFDGLSALKIALKKCPDVPFIFVSGTLGEEVAIEALHMGATDYLLKERLSRIAPSVQRASREAKERIERKRAEDAARETQAWFRGIHESSRDAVISVDSHQRILLFNQGAENIFGYPRAEVIGRPLDLLLPRRVEEVHRKHFKDFARSPDVARTMGQRREVAGRRKDGGEFPAEASISKLDVGSELVFTVILRDITERRRAEEERQAHLWFLESMDKVNRAIQGASDLEQLMSDVLDAVLSICDCDRAWLVYPCDPEAPSWKVPMEHTRPEFPGAFDLALELPVDAEVAKVFQAVRASGSPVRFGPGSDPPMPAEAAQRFSIQSMIAMTIYPKGDKPYMFGLHQCSYPRVWTPQEERLFQEIGRRLEDALTSLLMFRTLRESERKLEEAQHIAHVGYWDLDFDTNVVVWSDETYRIFGLSPEEGGALTLGRVRELIHPEDRQLLTEGVAGARRGGAHELEFRVVRPSGEVRVIHSRGEVTWDGSGRPRRTFGTVQDITERKRAVQRLVAQHAVTQILAEAATLEEATPRILQTVCEGLAWDLGVFWRIDREAGVLRCAEVWIKKSRAAPQFAAATRAITFPPGSGLPGRVWSSRERAYIRDVVHDENFLRGPIAATEGIHSAFGFPILLGGEVLGVVEFFSGEIGQPDQELLEMMATIGSQMGQFIDRKRAEEALLRAQAELAHVTRLATLGELTASIAHEINQPLAAIVNNANACLRWLAGDSPNLAEGREAARLIARDGKRAGDVIARIRALVHKVDTQKAPLNINDAVEEVAMLAQAEVRRNGVALRMQLAAGLPPVVGDRVQLQQVILNLVMNGVEAMASVADRPRALLLRSRLHEPDRVLVAVQDSGVGIDQQSLEKIFDAFYTTKSHGMGMGLAISRSIIESHGGQLWATASERGGAVFQFTLPAGGGTP